MEISMRIDHGPVQTNTMSYSQRQPQNHRPSHGQATHAADIYKPSRSPLSAAGRYPYPSSPQLQPQPSPTSAICQVPAPQRYQAPPTAAAVVSVAGVAAAAPPPLLSSGGVYRDYRSNRISLLHPEYGPGRPRDPMVQAGVVCVDGLQGGGQQPLKKMRLQDKESVQPLRIDTRDQPGTYHPQVEAISPTFPDQLTQDDQAFRTTKDELIQQISKVDREIAKAESQISILKKKQTELEEIASKPSVKLEVEEDAPKHQSLPQKIYAENKRKAQSAHAQLDSLGPKVDWPLYNQPADTAVYHENARKNVVFKKRLLEYFKRRHAEKEARNNYLSETYSKLMQEWIRKADKIENSTKRKSKEAKNREFFEKVFPELRKQREDKERFNRVGARVKSEADMEEIMDNLQEQALEEKKMRSLAVIPPIPLDQRERRLRYYNNNGFVEDMEAVYKSKQFFNVWTPSEKEIFKEKYLQHPKNFGVIASYLERKSASDCVQYYYLSKKTENYKQLFRKTRQRTRNSRNHTAKASTSANTSIVDIMTSGVTTRLQREQQAKTVNQQSRGDSQQQQLSEPSTSASPPATAAATSASSATTTAAASRTSSPSLLTSNCVSASTASVISTGGSAAATAARSPSGAATGDHDASMDVDEPECFGGTSDEFFGKETAKEATGVIQEGRKQPEAAAAKKDGDSPQEIGSDQDMMDNSLMSENKKKKERRKDNDVAMETSDEEASNAQDKACHGNCAVCQAQLGPQLHSRPLAPSQASQYGLREEDVAPNARVCNTCRCKCVRSRYTHCPLPTCPNSRGRIKRLRSFPYRLQDLPPDVREPLLAEFRIPSGVTKCCSACFNRIQRRLGPVEEWADEEVGKLRTALTELGANWQAIGDRLNRTAHQVRSFYAANRKRLSLEGCLGDRKPTLTDEEESGSSTSSCEEPIRERSNSSDTASAAESPPVQGNSNPIKKEDYDSSATETADEAQTPDHYQVSATITPVITDGQQRQNTSPLSVKDLVLGVIENSFKKNPVVQQQTQNPPVSGMAPTISSILNNDSNEVTIVSEYNLNNIAAQQRGQVVQQRPDLNLAKLTLIGATITPVSGPIQTQPMEPLPPSRDDLIVTQVPDGRDPETLDLSIKKPREPPPPMMSKHQQQMQQQQQQQHRSEQQYIYHQDRPPFYMRSQPKLPSPKPANPKAGSITLGTPIISQPRGYEGLLRQMPEAKMGSITQGTPIHLPHNMQEKRVYDYFSKARGQMPPQQVQSQPVQNPGQYRAAYAAVDQQLSSQQLTSRQIIMNDYITSQQMVSKRNDKPQYYPASSPHRTPPPPPQSQQQRQGVIQRHTRPQYLQPGHEALSSLVDVAVQQPSLPVPSAPHEGLGKTIADNILEQPHRYQMIQHQQQLRQQQRMEEQRRAAFHHQQAQHQLQQQAQQQRQHPRTDSSTMTAASLIDAIITHQINQTAEGGREVVQNTREQRAGDLLFHKVESSQQQGQDNGERPPSVISVDLDMDAINKNLTVKELTDSVISHDFGSRQPNYYHLQESMTEQWKRRMQQQKEDKRAQTPQQQQDERQIIRIAQPQQKYHIERVEPVSPPENNHWSEQNYRRYQQPQSHISPLDYVKNRIVEVMRTEDDKKDGQEGLHLQDKDRSDSPGDMVIDEEKHDGEFGAPPPQQQQQPQGGFYPFVHKDSTASERNNEPKPLLSAQYEPLSDED